MPLPYKPWQTLRSKGLVLTIRADVGRDALIPPDLLPAQTPRADMESAPTTGGEHRGQPGNYGLATPQTPVGGRYLHRPAHPGAATRFRGRDKSRPYEQILCFGPNRNGRSPPGRRRAGCPHPAGPPAGAKTPGGYGIRPYDRRRAPRPTGKLRPCHTTNPCRGRCLHRPGGHAPPQGFAGGINPAPTNKFCVSGQTGTAAPHRADVGRDALIPPGLPLAQKPGRIWNPPRYDGGRARAPYRAGKSRRSAGNPTPNPCRGRCSHRPGAMRRRKVRGRDKSRPYEQILCFGQTGTAAPSGRT